MMSYNFINFIHIVDISLLNFIDYFEVIEDSYQIIDDKFYINLNTKNKKILTAFILNNLNDAIQYGKINVIVNTCTPMMNWRQKQRSKAIRSYKYLINDNSVKIDLIKLNQFLDKLFERLPDYNINIIKKEYEKMDTSLDFIDLNHLQIIGNVKFIEFERIDNYDIFPIIKTLFSNLGSLTFDIINYNILTDGNYVYEHNSSFPDDLQEQVRLEFLQKGLI